MNIRLRPIREFVAIPLFVFGMGFSTLAQERINWQLWLDQDVRWIITPEEKQAFLGLNNNQERDEFIRQFWVRRDPNPASPENKFREEHYRRIAYANMHFAGGEPGWKTDRGRVYIVFGQPDSVDSQPIAVSGATKSVEVWHYRIIRVGWPPDLEQDALRHSVQPTIIKNFDFRFVDECSYGQYRLESPWPSAPRIPDEETALRIAERRFISAYGKKRTDAERPLSAKLIGAIWYVSGTLWCNDGHGGRTNDPGSCLGGVALIKLRQRDGKVLSITHGK